MGKSGLVLAIENASERLRALALESTTMTEVDLFHAIHDEIDRLTPIAEATVRKAENATIGTDS
jgi:hypothetical protein